MRIVVVGGGITGGNAAVGLREEGFDGDVVLLGDEPGLPFGRPPLSKGYLLGEEKLELVKPGDWYDDHRVELRDDARVKKVDPANGRVVLTDGGQIACDRVLIATGCRPRTPPVPGVDLEGVLTLRRKADCDEIRDRALEPGAKAVVVGMSFIGAEVAAALRGLGVEVAAVFPGPGPLASVLGPRVARRMAEIHRDRGVEMFADEKVARFEGNGRVEEVVTRSGRRVGCTVAVVGVGVEPNVDVLEGSGVAVDDGVLVDGACRTNVDGVFAAGDVADHLHPVFGRIRVEHYNNAEKQGRYAARALLGTADPYDYVHTFWSDQYDHKLEYVGFAKSWDDFVVRGDVEDGPFLGFYLRDGVLVAAMGLDRGGDPEAEPDSELSACVKLVRGHARPEPSSLADPDTGLWALAGA